MLPQAPSVYPLLHLPMGKRKSIIYYSPEDPVLALEGKAYLPGYGRGEGGCELEISKLPSSNLLQLVPCVEPGIHPLRKDQNTRGTVKVRDDRVNNHLFYLYLQGHGGSLWQAKTFPSVVFYPLLHFYQFPLLPQHLLCPSKPQGWGGAGEATVQLLSHSAISWLGACQVV